MISKSTLLLHEFPFFSLPTSYCNLSEKSCSFNRPFHMMIVNMVVANISYSKVFVIRVLGPCVSLTLLGFFFSENITLQAPVTICSFSKLISQFLKAIIDRIWEGSKHFSLSDYLIKTRNPCWGCMVKIIIWTRLELVTFGKLGPVDLIIHVNGHVFINVTS